MEKCFSPSSSQPTPGKVGFYFHQITGLKKKQKKTNSKPNQHTFILCPQRHPENFHWKLGRDERNMGEPPNGRCLEWGSKDIVSKKDFEDQRLARF